MEVLSPGFSNQGFIPAKYTCEGRNINPELIINKLPETTKSLVIIVDDPDAPVRTWTHWVVWNIPPTTKIKENSIPGIVGLTDFREQKYSGPCPPSGEHYYHFKIYALDSLLDLNPRSTKLEVEKEMNRHIIAFGEIVGLFKRDK